MAIDDLQQSPEFQGVLQQLPILLGEIRPLVVAPFEFQALEDHRRKLSEFGGKQT